MAKITREKFKTMNTVFDNFTERNIYRLISKGLIDGLESPLAMGKEANVFTAQTSEGSVIVKIYRLENCDFNKMYSYIKADARYLSVKRNRRSVIFSWTQREYRNLMKARFGGVNVPKPIHQIYNIVLMSLIGGDSPAPMLKDAPPKNPDKFLKDVVDQMGKLYKAGIVHGDLSSFNILNYNDTPYFIDFSQATTTESNQARELIERDVKNIVTYFQKIGIKKLDQEEILKKVIK